MNLHRINQTAPKYLQNTEGHYGDMVLDGLPVNLVVDCESAYIVSYEGSDKYSVLEVPFVIFGDEVTLLDIASYIPSRTNSRFLETLGFEAA